MASDPGMYKTLLRLVSGAAHEIVTRKKLSQQSRDSASALARALQSLLADGDELRPVKALLDEAASTLSRSSPDLQDARARLEGALAHEQPGKRTAAKKRATKSALGGLPAAEPSVGKKTASKKRAAATNAGGKRQATKGATSVASASATSASKKRTSKKASARAVGAGSKKTSSKKRQAKRSGSD